MKSKEKLINYSSTALCQTQPASGMRGIAKDNRHDKTRADTMEIMTTFIGQSRVITIIQLVAEAIIKGRLEKRESVYVRFLVVTNTSKRTALK